MDEPVTITFDTNIPALASIRSFWATLCEDIGQRMTLVPTAASELLRRVRLESEREWGKRLKEINIEQEIGWNKIQIRRLSTLASTAARDWLKEEMKHQGSIYTIAESTDSVTEELEAELEDVLPEEIFDLMTDNGIRDRKIVIEALARGFHVLASNNIGSIDHELLEDWLASNVASGIGVKSTILRPMKAEAKLRKSYGKPLTWTLSALARASVTDPFSPVTAALEMAKAMEHFHERGMVELRGRHERMMLDKQVFDAALESVKQRGVSLAQHANTRMGSASIRAVTKQSGIDISHQR